MQMTKTMATTSTTSENSTTQHNTAPTSCTKSSDMDKSSKKKEQQQQQQQQLTSTHLMTQARPSSTKETNSPSIQPEIMPPNYSHSSHSQMRPSSRSTRYALQLPRSL
ncbi:unnamed protein product [Absidia cylindrospora]